jgi:hypothetical protein
MCNINQPILYFVVLDETNQLTLVKNHLSNCDSFLVNFEGCPDKMMCLAFIRVGSRVEYVEYEYVESG